MESKKMVLERCAFAKWYGYQHQNDGVVEDADAVEKFVKSPDFDMHDLLAMSEYQTIVRVWSK